MMANNNNDLSLHPNVRRMLEKLQAGCPNPDCTRLPAQIHSSGRVLPTGRPDPNVNMAARCMACLARWEVTPTGAVVHFSIPVLVDFPTIEEFVDWRKTHRVEVEES